MVQQVIDSFGNKIALLGNEKISHGGANFGSVWHNGPLLRVETKEYRLVQQVIASCRDKKYRLVQQAIASYGDKEYRLVQLVIIIFQASPNLSILNQAFKWWDSGRLV